MVDLDTPILFYVISNPTGCKIFNLNKFVTNIDVKAFLDDSLTLPCESIGSPSVDIDHSHIIKGNLKIVINSKFRKLFSKGLKYQEFRTAYFEKAEESTNSWIKSYIES